MSWMKTNYHIAALGGGALVLAGLGYLGYSGNNEVNESLVIPAAGKGKDTATKGGDLAAAVIKNVTGPNPVEQRKTTKGRPVNLFTSVDLYTKVGEPKKLIDILKVAPIHPPMDNQWWVDHRLDLTFSDSPFRDADRDGFNNRDEFQDETDPNDPKDYGDLIDKLEVASVESDLWRPEFFANPSAGPQFKFTYKKFGTRRSLNNEIRPGNGVAEGALFFDDEPGKGRFKLKEMTSKLEDTSVGKVDRPYATLEDQRPNKLGKTYKIPLRPDAKERRDALNADFTVVFRLNAIGEEGNLFKVEENGSFSLPAGGEKKGYKLIEVEADKNQIPLSVTVEYLKGGEKKTRKIEVPKS